MGLLVGKWGEWRLNAHQHLGGAGLEDRPTYVWTTTRWQFADPEMVGTARQYVQIICSGGNM